MASTMPRVPAPCGGNVGAVQPKAVNAPRMPAVPAPCGGNAGAVQPKAANTPRMPAVPAPCGGNVAHVAPVQPKAVRSPAPAAILQAKALVRPSRAPATIQRAAAAKDYRSDKKYAGVWWPVNPADRPYESMKDAEYPGSASRFKDFTADQRQAILAANKAKNGGTLKSDAKEDPHQDLVAETGKPNSAEIDHIIPKSKGGSNHYLNARVISWELNNKIARVKDTTGLTTM